MPTKRISFSNYDRKLNLAGGREQGGPGSVRRASGVAPEATTSVLSRWGSELLYPIDAIQLYYWNGNRYQYDGSNLYSNGVSIMAGFNGERLAFNSMPPQPGLQDYLFVLGGGVTPFKISPTGTISNWGIVEPPNGMQAANAAADLIVIDTFDTDAANWTPNANVTVGNEATEYAVINANDAGGSLKINPSASPWRIHNTFSATPQDWSQYSNGDFSLNTDVFQLWFFFTAFGGTIDANKGSLSTWLQIDFDVNDGTFKKDFFSIIIGLIPAGSTNPKVKKNAAFDVRFETAQWQQLTFAKSQMLRHGIEYQYDWSCVQAMRLAGGNFTGNLYVDYFTLMGGCEMGAGPAVANGGSEYDYYTVYRNLITGSQSNPQNNPAQLFNVQVNKGLLTQIPISPDPQVGARDLYRTQALTQPGGGVPFYLDTIYDNTTTTYTDDFADFSVRLTTTPWTKGIVVPPANQASGAGYYIDAGNGYYFKLTTPGTTGTPSPPQWVVPETQWGPNDVFVLTETVAPIKANGQFWIVTTAGKSGLIEPNWAAFTSLGDTITDGQGTGAVVWTNQGTKTTNDNGVIWEFQGINSTLVLGNNDMLLDNAPPLITYGDADGPTSGSMYWCRDSAPGSEGYVYISPPGRPESVGQIYQITSNNDPTQKLVEWDGKEWVATLGTWSYLTGSYPQISSSSFSAETGTSAPFTVVAHQFGIICWAGDGIRILNWAGSKLFGFAELAPIFRGQGEENVPAWSDINPPLWAALGRDEIIFSDSTSLTIALAYDGLPQGGLAWRMPGRILTAFEYSDITGGINAAWGGKVYLFEQPGELTDGGNPIPFELQTGGDFPDVGAEFTSQRLYVAANLNVSGTPQQLVPTLIVDGNEYTLPTITNTKRTIIELSPKVFGRLFDGIRFTGNLTGRIEIYSVSADVWLGQGQPE
jgi:hypothetical protein